MTGWVKGSEIGESFMKVSIFRNPSSESFLFNEVK